MEQEIWKDIQGFEGYYQVSNYGRIKSLKRDVYDIYGNRLRSTTERIKKLKKDHDGYLKTTLSVNGVNKTFFVHRLVAINFIGCPNDDTTEINHKDTNRTNNHVNNLEWATHLDNILHSAKLGKYKNRSGKNNSNYNKHTLHDYYQKHPEERKKLARHGGQNGTAIPINVYDKNYNLIHQFSYIGAAVKWLQEEYHLTSSTNTIRQHINKSLINQSLYLNHYFSRTC